jgi:hypothetical protein
MTTLTVRDFSCIDHARLELSRFTILIGPQASGKSVLSKLVYFFQDALNGQIAGADVESDFEGWKDRVSADFKRWFPPSAWGSKKFHIEFESGPIVITIDRKKSYKKPSDGFHITFSTFFVEFFNRTSENFRSALIKANEREDVASYVRWEVMWQVRNDARKQLSAVIGDDYIANQMFVPAGRAFFTSVGKAIAAFDRGGFLDPATLAFGRYWAAMRDNDPLGFSEVGFPRSNAKLMTEIFGGELKVDRDLEYVLSPDGRRVPLGALSSGQQELLPLWMTLERYFSEDERGSQPLTSMMYIEEPEAHLFPHAQSMLIEYLASKLYVPAKNGRRMLITTHSPYVLSKINNLVKASIVAQGSNREQISRINSLIPRHSWVRREHMSAYAIIDKRLVPIVNDLGLIDAEYLDSVSEEIMSQFSTLLEIEYAD